MGLSVGSGTGFLAGKTGGFDAVILLPMNFPLLAELQFSEL